MVSSPWDPQHRHAEGQQHSSAASVHPHAASQQTSPTCAPRMAEDSSESHCLRHPARTAPTSGMAIDS